MSATASAAAVRPARTGDLPAVAGIHRHYVLHSVATFEEEPHSVARWRARYDELSRLGLPFLVADADGGVAGYACAGPWRPKPAYRHTAEVSVYLAPGRTGRGLGTALLGRLVEDCAAAGLHSLVAVIAEPGGDASVALHRRLGFTPAGRLAEVGYKHGRLLDTALMQLLLPAAPGPGAPGP
ncbi:GNAT family N-acetyltransferase [Streptomyces marincola]|uniref:GNAT family N-acetyltransferase n=1 Tax=Streptomyces marincola TaxID=2878388 RepID=UPI001CF0D8DE|nr:GNAT family N-acetyltransferase [Streptomyces marincola]UCM91438.1 N-acetyltransferase family protein [Streptomyces marincola]